MKQLILLMTALILALCAGAGAEGQAEYPLPEALRTVSSFPDDGGAGPRDQVRVVSFSASDGHVSLELDRQVSRLKIMEYNYLSGTDSTVFTKKNTSAAEAHQTGKGESAFRVLVTWESETGALLEQEFNTWYGGLSLDHITITENLDPTPYMPCTGARRTATYDGEGSLLSETVTVDGEEETLVRTVRYGMYGIEAVRVNWNREGNRMGAEITARGELVYLEYAEGETCFRARGVDAVDDVRELWLESVNPGVFDAKLRQGYPQMAGMLSSALSTMTDLGPATMTDMPGGRMDSLPGGGYLWSLNFENEKGNPGVLVFMTTDQLFVYQDGSVVLNKEAVNVYGMTLSLEGNTIPGIPVFEMPEIL